MKENVYYQRLKKKKKKKYKTPGGLGWGNPNFPGVAPAGQTAGFSGGLGENEELDEVFELLFPDNPTKDWYLCSNNGFVHKNGKPVTEEEFNDAVDYLFDKPEPMGENILRDFIRHIIAESSQKSD